ncbi:signal peptidase I [Bacillus sp. FJAT-27445]|uniref:signal peptidase I n=1 Tax=Bacillus sp. FJAT-27445 TaxID=1679166 RepID=UPI0007436F50|nr:signal peptidase I [Bacillus sp. FJAT-27445]
MRALAINDVASEKKIHLKKRTSIIGWIQFAVLIGLILFTFRFATGLEIINGNSMNPTISHNSVLFINKIFFTPQRGDIVVLESPQGYQIIKRIIGMPGDIISITNGTLYLNGNPVEETYTNGQSIDIMETTVPEGEIFVIGDNRPPGESLDSRDPNIGTFPLRNIVGIAMFSIFPLNNIK